MVRLRLESDDVIFKHRIYQPFMLGHRDEHIRWRKGNMQEKADAIGGAAGAQVGGERDQMIIVHPDEIALGQQRRERFREAIVNPAKALAVLLSEACEIEAIVKHRPKPLVAIAKIIFLKFTLRE